jgi:hypothetical protein
VPTGRYFKDIKKRLMAVSPTIDRSSINLLLWPKMGMPLTRIYVLANTSEPIDLKKTISKVGK